MTLDYSTIGSWYAMRPGLQPDQHPTDYGRIALRYMLAAEVELFGLFTDQELDSAAHAARWAVTARDMDPAAVERITQLHLRIVAVLSARQVERLPPQPPPEVPTAEGTYGTYGTDTGPDSDDGGRKAPLLPRPKTNPPAPALAVPDWRF